MLTYAQVFDEASAGMWLGHCAVGRWTGTGARPCMRVSLRISEYSLGVSTANAHSHSHWTSVKVQQITARGKLAAAGPSKARFGFALDISRSAHHESAKFPFWRGSSPCRATQFCGLPQPWACRAMAGILSGSNPGSMEDVWAAVVWTSAKAPSHARAPRCDFSAVISFSHAWLHSCLDEVCLLLNF